eukprot:5263593-Amphidinium_carterae.1
MQCFLPSASAQLSWRMRPFATEATMQTMMTTVLGQAGPPALPLRFPRNPSGCETSDKLEPPNSPPK